MFFSTILTKFDEKRSFFRVFLLFFPRPCATAFFEKVEKLEVFCLFFFAGYAPSSTGKYNKGVSRPGGGVLGEGVSSLRRFYDNLREDKIPIRIYTPLGTRPRRIGRRLTGSPLSLKSGSPSTDSPSSSADGSRGVSRGCGTGQAANPSVCILSTHTHRSRLDSEVGCQGRACPVMFPGSLRSKFRPFDDRRIASFDPCDDS